MSSVLKTLEDFGFEVFDNFPLPLVKPLMDEGSNNAPIAIGIDTRTRGFSSESVLETAEKLGAKLVFVTCDDNVLQRRFTETRRRHPLAKDKSVRHGLEQEQTLLSDIEARADLRIDTTRLSIHDLRHILEGHFGQWQNKKLSVNLISFGFRGGLPREADIVMDVRFLQNPHWVADLKPKTGLDKEVAEYIAADESFDEFLMHFKSLIELLLPRYRKEGKNYLTIAIGCTGGKHRSVFVVEHLAKWLADKDIQIHHEHRDLKLD